MVLIRTHMLLISFWSPPPPHSLSPQFDMQSNAREILSVTFYGSTHIYYTVAAEEAYQNDSNDEEAL